MRDTQNKKDEIISMAMEVFAKRGYEGTSLDEIARYCNITKPAIYYHFKNKLALYEYILCTQFEEMAKRILEHTDSGSAEDRLRAYIVTFGQYLIDNPTFSAIFSREISTGGETLPQGCIDELSKTLKRLSEILEDGVKEGIFQDENPFLVQMMIVTPLSAYHTTKPLRQKVADIVDNKYLSVEVADIVDTLSDKIISAIKI